MSATDQFPPRHLLPDEGAGKDSNVEEASTGAEKTESGSEPSAGKPTLALPATSSAAATRDLDVSGEQGTTTKVALDELGPMVVNKDGTLSRIHNWSSMTDSERERTLRVLGKRNQLRMGELRGEELCGPGTAGKQNCAK